MTRSKSINAALIRYGIVAIVVVVFSGFGVYAVYRFLSTKKNLDIGSAQLITSSKKQAEQIIPGLLLEEEYGSVKLQLDKIKTDDALDKVWIEEDLNSVEDLGCRPVKGTDALNCSSILDSRISIAVPIKLPGQSLGFLIKERTNGSEKDNLVRLVMLSLLFVFFLAFGWFVWSIFRFIEIKIRRPLADLSSTLGPMIDSDGDISFSKLTVAEVDNLAEQIVDLVEKYQKKKYEATVGSIASQVAHDIRSPLAALKMISKDLGEVEEEKRVLLRSAITRIQDIANNLLATSKKNMLEISKQEIVLLSNLLEGVVTEKRLQYRGNKKIQIHSSMNEKAYGIFVNINSVEFGRIISNLVDNAVDAFCLNQGSVFIDFESDTENATISVKDNGRGIPEELIPKLGMKGNSFGKVGGSGLGLYHAKTIVQSWGGKIHIDSTIGVGTTVRLVVPLAKAPSWFVEKIDIDLSEKIVIADDDESVLKVWERRFECAKIKNEVIQFSSTEDVGQWVSKNGIKNTIFLIDYEFVGSAETGIDLIEKLGMKVQAILVTSRFDEPILRERCASQGIRLMPKNLVEFVPLVNQNTMS